MIDAALIEKKLAFIETCLRELEGEPETNRALFDLLHKHGLVDDRLAETLYAMAGFRNVLVHGYQEVDLHVVRDILENRLDDLLAFVAAIRSASL